MDESQNLNLFKSTRCVDKTFCVQLFRKRLSKLNHMAGNLNELSKHKSMNLYLTALGTENTKLLTEKSTTLRLFFDQLFLLKPYFVSKYRNIFNHNEYAGPMTWAGWIEKVEI